MTRPSIEDEVQRYLTTGDSDPYHAAWRGQTFVEQEQHANEGFHGDGSTGTEARQDQ